MNGDSSLAVFCDFENIALGVRDTKYKEFDLKPVLERLLLKGSIVVKKAYCDWDRYKTFKRVMHEAAFEMIEIPHTRQAGKNSADIRMVVDALDLCYTKEHIDTFVIVSGDSDFSPLVSKLRENAKMVIGVGVKNATSDLLVGNCDEFIFYDDLVRELQPKPKRAPRKPAPAASAGKPAAAPKAKKPASADDRDDKMQEGIDLVLDTADALFSERDDRSTLWGSMVKQTLKRRQPGFNETYYGFRSFNDLLEEAEDRGELELELDERSGGYIIRKILDLD
ncbi:MAG: NYN domain-containing protein [Proteobacteria bacterium]|nr:NYN domain-containing protein [Pseudomonadota bacterium]